MALQIPDPNNPGEFLTYEPDFSDLAEGMARFQESGLNLLLQDSLAQQFGGESKYEQRQTPEQKRLGIQGLLYDKETGELAPEKVNHALRDISGALSSGGAAYIPGVSKLNLVQQDDGTFAADPRGTITFDQFKELVDEYKVDDEQGSLLKFADELPAITFDSVEEQVEYETLIAGEVKQRQKTRDKANKLKNFQRLGKLADVFTGGTGIGTAIGTYVGGGDIDDAVKEGLQTAAVLAGGQNFLEGAYNAANPATAMAETAKAAAPTTIAGTAKENIKEGIESITGAIPGIDKGVSAVQNLGIVDTVKDFIEPVTDFVEPVTDFVEKEVKGVGEVLGIDKEKRDEFRDFVSDTEDKAKEEIKKTGKKAEDEIKEVVAGDGGGLSGAGKVLGAAGIAALLDQILNPEIAPDQYAAFREQYEAGRPQLTGFAPVGSEIPRVGIAGMYHGGEVEGPGTGTSDSIPALLSDGEFVMTAKAVLGAGNGDRDKGAAKMYDMMAKFEGMA